MFAQVRVPILGLVENMSYLIAPGSGERIDVFGQGGGRRTAEQMQVPFLGEIALDPQVRVGGDSGMPVTAHIGDEDPSAAPFVALAKLLEERASAATSSAPSITIED
jgi:ATP-binding protein involved in chromosome partitioning